MSYIVQSKAWDGTWHHCKKTKRSMGAIGSSWYHVHRETTATHFRSRRGANRFAHQVKMDWHQFGKQNNCKRALRVPVRVRHIKRPRTIPQGAA